MVDQPTAAIREEILAALSAAGAFCGDCGFEPGEIGCSDCVRVRDMYADALTPITDRLRAELEQHREVARTDSDKIDRLSSWAMNTKHGAAAAEVVLILNNGQTPADPPAAAKPQCTCGEGPATLHWSNCRLYTDQ